MTTPLRDISASLTASNSLRTADAAAYAGLRTYLSKAEDMNRGQVLSILAEEHANNPRFKQSWSAATSALQGLYQDGEDVGLTRDHCTALTCYTLQKPNICREFNTACRLARQTESSWREFRFKSLWCLLIDAFKLLPKFEGIREKFYRGVTRKLKFESSSICFGQFVSASVSHSEASKFKFDSSEGTIMTFESVPVEYVRDISKFSVYPQHQEVLIWPLCVFKCLEPSGERLRFQKAEDFRKPMQLDTTAGYESKAALERNT